MYLYHGNMCKELVIDHFNDFSFFSTDEFFAREFGDILYEVEFNPYCVFDILEEECFNHLTFHLLNYGYNKIEDCADPEAIEIDFDYTVIINSLYIFDSWRLTENYLPIIQELGYHCAKVTESEVTNYCVFNGNDINIIKRYKYKGN